MKCNWNTRRSNWVNEKLQRLNNNIWQRGNSRLLPSPCAIQRCGIWPTTQYRLNNSTKVNLKAVLRNLWLQNRHTLNYIQLFTSYANISNFHLYKFSSYTFLVPIYAIISKHNLPANSIKRLPMRGRRLIAALRKWKADAYCSMTKWTSPRLYKIFQSNGQK